MSLKHNILINYASQIYVTLIGIVMVPMYLKYMGAEAYGLVGIFAMLQAWFNLLDIGLTVTLARETASFRGGAMNALTFRRLVRAIEGIFLAVALLGGGALYSMSNWIATKWLVTQQLPTSDIAFVIKLMSVSVSLRWMSGIYRGQITGAECWGWLSVYNMLLATMKFVVVLPILIYVNANPKVFFGYQLVISIIELSGVIAMAYLLMPKIPTGERLAWSWTPLKPVLKFSFTVAFASSLWVLVTQTDKLVLSKILPLAEYGYFTLAVLVASGIMIVSGPVSAVIMPRMAKLNAEGNDVELISLYRKSTQLVAIIALPATLVLAFFSEQVLWAWTGNVEVAHNAAPVLTLYALGNGMLALGAFSYYLQVAKGKLKLHPIGTALYVAILLPSLLWATSNYGINGPGYAWFGTNAVFFILWLPFVHRQFGKSLHIQWLHDLAGIAITTVVVLTLLLAIVSWPEVRLSVALRVIMVSILLLISAACGSSMIREALHVKWRNRISNGIAQ